MSPCAGLLWLSLARAGEESPPPPAAPRDVAPSERALALEEHFAVLPEVPPGLLVLVLDPTGQLQVEAPSLRVEDGGRHWTVALADDGRPPDANAGDRAWTGVAELPELRSATFTLLDAEGTDLWSDPAPLSAPATRPRVGFLLEGAFATVLLRTYNDAGGQPIAPGEEPAPEEEPPPEVRTPGGDEPPPGRAGAPNARSGSLGGRAGPPWGTLALILQLGAIAGAAVRGVAVRGSRGAPALCPPGGLRVPALPGLRGPGGAAWWRLPDDATRIEALLGLVRALAPRAPLLLVPRAGSRARLAEALAGQRGVFWLQADRPARQRIERAARGLAQLGRPVLLVEGLEALEPPTAQEGPAEVLEELVDAPPRGLDLCVLSIAGEPSEDEPALALEACPAGLAGPDGLVFATLGDGLVPCFALPATSSPASAGSP